MDPVDPREVELEQLRARVALLERRIRGAHVLLAEARPVGSPEAQLARELREVLAWHEPSSP